MATKTRRIECSKKSPSKLEIEVDELWGMAQHTAHGGKKRVKKEVWLAIDRATREIKRFHIGGRGKEILAILTTCVIESLRKIREKIIILSGLIISYDKEFPD